MNCYRCTTPLPDDSRYCLACGADVSGEGRAEKTLAVETDPELMAKLQAEVGSEYVIERELGRGGMAIVFLGHDAELRRKVAVKILPPELTFGAGSRVVERFRREARTAATLDHPNIIPVHRVSQSGKLFWYVMKFLEGESLDQILERDGQLAVDRTIGIVRQTGDALDYAHQNQVIHRDIKPANIMLDAKGRVTVTDFGIAKALDANTLTASGSMIGTPYYMSPEQCSGKRVGPASDQYSLAVTTYQMLGGHLPFTGESVVDIVHKHVMDPVPPLLVLRPQLPEALVAVVERGLAKHPEERFATCSEFAKGLDEAARGVDFTASPPQRPAGSGTRMSKTALVSPVPGALLTAKGMWRRRKGALIGAGATLALAVGVGALMLAQRGRRVGGEPESAPSGKQDPTSISPIAATESGGEARRPGADSSQRTDSVSRADSIERAGRAGPAGRNVVSGPTSGLPPASTTQPVPNRQAGLGDTMPSGRTDAARSEPTPMRPSVAYISVGTQPRSTIYVNGQAVPRYPLVNYQVPAGAVRLRFQVADSSGLWWAQDREVTVGAGDTIRLGFIRLVKP